MYCVLPRVSVPSQSLMLPTHVEHSSTPFNTMQSSYRTGVREIFSYYMHVLGNEGAYQHLGKHLLGQYLNLEQLCHTTTFGDCVGTRLPKKWSDTVSQDLTTPRGHLLDKLLANAPISCDSYFLHLVWPRMCIVSDEVEKSALCACA